MYAIRQAAGNLAGATQTRRAPRYTENMLGYGTVSVLVPYLLVTFCLPSPMCLTLTHDNDKTAAPPHLDRGFPRSKSLILTNMRGYKHHGQELEWVLSGCSCSMHAQSRRQERVCTGLCFCLPPCWGDSLTQEIRVTYKPRVNHMQCSVFGLS